jgi:osmotically-inducible protein OsmY
VTSRAAIVAVLLAGLLPAFGGRHLRERPSADAAAHCGANDEAVAAAVLARLTTAFGDASAIEIRVHDGVVTLTGAVGDDATRNRAVKESYAVDGVERVENRLRIVAPPVNPRGM